MKQDSSVNKVMEYAEVIKAFLMLQEARMYKLIQVSLIEVFV